MLPANAGNWTISRHHSETDQPRGFTLDHRLAPRSYGSVSQDLRDG